MIVHNIIEDVMYFDISVNCESLISSGMKFDVTERSRSDIIIVIFVMNFI